MRAKGMFTVEAAYIFTFIMVIIYGIFQITFYLHDVIVGNSSKIQAGIRLYEAKAFIMMRKGKDRLQPDYFETGYKRTIF